MEPSQRIDTPAWRENFLYAGLPLFAFVLVRWVTSLGFPWTVDEAYYRLWSEQLALSYFDHPPLVAWTLAAIRIPFELLGFSVAVGETSDLALVRFPAALLTAIAGFSAFLWLRRRGLSPRMALGGAFAGLTLPLLAAGGALFTPDSLMVPCTWLAFTSWESCLESRKRRHALAFGFWIGLGLLAKYTMALVLVPVLFSLWNPRTRRRATAALVFAVWPALLLVSPVVVWNASHDWLSFRFQLAHGLGGEFNPLGFLDFSASQALLLGPPLVGLGIALWKKENLRRLSQHEPLLLTFALTPFVFFGIASFFAPPEANWPAAGYLPLALWLFTKTAQSTHARRLFVANSLLGVLLFAGLALGSLAGPWRGPLASRLCQGEFADFLNENSAVENAPVIVPRYEMLADLYLFGRHPGENFFLDSPRGRSLGIAPPEDVLSSNFTRLQPFPCTAGEVQIARKERREAWTNRTQTLFLCRIARDP